MTVFRGKVVWITGAGSGIGRAVARMFAADGATLVLIGRRADKLRSVDDEVCSSGGRGEVVALDVCRRGEVDAAAAGLLERHERVDVLRCELLICTFLLAANYRIFLRISRPKIRSRSFNSPLVAANRGG